MEELAKVFGLLLQRQQAKPAVLLALCWELRVALLLLLDANLLSSKQLQRIGRWQELKAFLRSRNATFSNSNPWARQWLNTAWDCVSEASTTTHHVDEEEDVERLDPDCELLDPREDYLGFKIVYFCRHPDGRGKFQGVCALLHLQVNPDWD